MRPEVNLARTGILARLVAHESEEIVFDPVEKVWYGTPGIMQRLYNSDNTTRGFARTCPGCGLLCDVFTDDRNTVRWDIITGHVDDLGTLSLSPSVRCHQCTWEGFLSGGVWQKVEVNEAAEQDDGV